MNVYLKFYAWAYMACGALGFIKILSDITNSQISSIAALAYLILIVQLGMGIYGGYSVIKNQLKGARILLWVSISCIPFFNSPIIDYYSGIGIGFVIYSMVGFFQFFNFEFNLNYFTIAGYDSLVGFLSGKTYIALGINVVPAFVAWHIWKCTKKEVSEDDSSQGRKRSEYNEPTF